ncbi:MAG TPA: universal stress protein, partial [Myxococcota bacterium]|nr:universal stress protein [Myxococcota bacterium]
AFAASLPKNQVDARVELGEPTEVITKLAEDLQVDLVVLGARGLTPSERFLVGSVSDRIVRHCKRPVTIVK